MSQPNVVADTVLSGPWTQDPTYTNLWIPAVSPGSAPIRVLEDYADPTSAATIPQADLIAAANETAANGASGNWVYAGGELKLRASDDSDPNSSGKVYRACAGGDGVTIDGAGVGSYTELGTIRLWSDATAGAGLIIRDSPGAMVVVDRIVGCRQAVRLEGDCSNVTLIIRRGVWGFGVTGSADADAIVVDTTGAGADVSGLRVVIGGGVMLHDQLDVFGAAMASGGARSFVNAAGASGEQLAGLRVEGDGWLVPVYDLGCASAVSALTLDYTEIPSVTPSWDPDAYAVLLRGFYFGCEGIISTLYSTAFDRCIFDVLDGTFASNYICRTRGNLLFRACGAAFDGATQLKAFIRSLGGESCETRFDHFSFYGVGGTNRGMLFRQANANNVWRLRRCAVLKDTADSYLGDDEGASMTDAEFIVEDGIVAYNLAASSVISSATTGAGGVRTITDLENAGYDAAAGCYWDQDPGFANADTADFMPVAGGWIDQNPWVPPGRKPTSPNGIPGLGFYGAYQKPGLRKTRGRRDGMVRRVLR